VIELHALGTLELRDPGDGHELRSVLAQPKRIALLAYLALARPRGFHSRERLFSIFWPDADQERARKALNQAVYVLRRSLGTGLLERREDGGIGLDEDRISCDALTFENALENGRAEEGLALYGGDLLDGFHLDGCPDFERWLDAERRRLQQRAVTAALSLADTLGATGTVGRALHWVRQASSWEPYDETILRRLISLQAELGDRSGAIREYEAFARRLSDELELQPSDETKALAEQIRSESPVRTEPAVATDSSRLAASSERAELAREIVETGGEYTFVPAADVGVGLEYKRASPKPILVAGALATIIVAIGWITWRSALSDANETRTPELEANRVLVLPFTNQTGRGDLDRLGSMAADWITQGLAETGLVRAVPSAGIEPAEALGGRGSPASRARSLAEASQSAIAVYGSFYLQADSLTFQAQVIDVATGELLRAVGDITAPVDRPKDAVELLRRRTTGALATVMDPLLEAWAGAAGQPPSYEAYALYAQGMEIFFAPAEERAERQAKYQRAADYFYQAAALDSTFTLPLLWALYAHMNLKEAAIFDSLASALDQRRDQLTRWERALLDAHLGWLAGDDAKAYHAYSRVVEMTPGAEWNFKLAEWARSPREIVDLLTAVDPEQGWLANWGVYWDRLTSARHDLGEHEQELADARRGRAQLPHDYRMVGYAELRALAALGRLEPPASQYDEQDLQYFVRELLAHGHALVAEELINDHLSRYDPGQDSLYRRAAFWLEVAGRTDEAETVLESATESNPDDWFAQTVLAILAAKQGDRERAEQISAWLDDFDVVSYMRGLRDEGQRALTASNLEYEPEAVRNYVRGLASYGRALIAAHLGDNDGALRLFQTAKDGAVYFDLHSDVHIPPTLRDDPSYQAFVRPEE
jgi:serine/threonine-protein kinase